MKTDIRTVYNYLGILKELGLIENKQPKWYSAESRRAFETKQDYDLALKHSEALLLSGETEMRFDIMNPYLAIDRLAFFDQQENKDLDDKCVLQHLQSDPKYHDQIYALLIQYRKLMDETDLSKIKGFPKLDLKQRNRSPEYRMVKKAPTFNSEGHVFSIQNKTISVERKKLNEIIDLADLLIGRLYSLVYSVEKHHIPLGGTCEYCPIRHITIKN